MLQPIRPQDAGQIYQRQVAPAEAAPVAPQRVDRSGGQAGGGRRADRVQFSAAALDLSRALQAASDAPDVREDRVEALRAAIENGTYQVDAAGIAERLAEQGFGA
ncbi:MAG: flagellar biosynthesis anti-sigma factor FlgM [Dehalococcoidia bacterium]